MDSTLSRKVAHKDKWTTCKLHNIAYKPIAGCSLCKKTINASLHENVLAVRQMLEQGMVDKQTVAKINDKMSDYLINIVDHCGQAFKQLLLMEQGDLPYTASKELRMSLDNVLNSLKQLTETKKQLSDLL
jgi:aconitase B